MAAAFIRLMRQLSMRRAGSMHCTAARSMECTPNIHDMTKYYPLIHTQNLIERNTMRCSRTQHGTEIPFCEKKTEAGKSFDVFFRSQSPPVVAHENDIWAHRTPATVKHLLVRATCTKHPTCIQHTVA